MLFLSKPKSRVSSRILDLSPSSTLLMYSRFFSSVMPKTTDHQSHSCLDTASFLLSSSFSVCQRRRCSEISFNWNSCLCCSFCCFLLSCQCHEPVILWLKPVNSLWFAMCSGSERSQSCVFKEDALLSPEYFLPFQTCLCVNECWWRRR